MICEVHLQPRYVVHNAINSFSSHARKAHRVPSPVQREPRIYSSSSSSSASRVVWAIPITMLTSHICEIVEIGKLTVQITLAGLGDPAASLVLILLEDTNLLKGLHDLAVNGAGGIDVVGWARATVAGGAVDLAKTADTDGLAEVDVAGDGRGADVVPVDRLRWELLGGASLDRVNPTYE